MLKQNRKYRPRNININGRQFRFIICSFRTTTLKIDFRDITIPQRAKNPRTYQGQVRGVLKSKGKNAYFMTMGLVLLVA